MAKTRSVSTKFWHDTWIQDLSTTSKLLYLYLITNDHLDLCGIYEISVRTICFESGLDRKLVEKSLEEFEKKGKIYHQDGWICIKNFRKNQKVNPNIQKGMERSLSLVPANTLEAFESLSKHSTPNLTLPNLTLPNEDSDQGEKINTYLENIISFWNGETEKEINSEKITLITSRGNSNPSCLIGESIMMKCRKPNEEIEKVYLSLKKKYTEEDFYHAIYQYAVDVSKRTDDRDKTNYCAHRFSFRDFMKQKNGFLKFVNYDIKI